MYDLDICIKFDIYFLWLVYFLDIFLYMFFCFLLKEGGVDIGYDILNFVLLFVVMSVDFCKKICMNFF